MKVLTGFYLALEIIFHILVMVVPDNNTEKEISIRILGGVTVALDMLLFFEFLTKVRKFMDITDF